MRGGDASRGEGTRRAGGVDAILRSLLPAFVTDLHGNNVEAAFHSPEPVVDAPRRTGVP